MADAQDAIQLEEELRSAREAWQTGAAEAQRRAAAQQAAWQEEKAALLAKASAVNAATAAAEGDDAAADPAPTPRASKGESNGQLIEAPCPPLIGGCQRS
eukprot:COSAG01_NODE_32113_length_586_cov_0.946612_2_plen_100_part_00